MDERTCTRTCAGIAYYPPSDLLYVTGKMWQRMHTARTRPEPQLGPEHVLRVCNLGIIVPAAHVAPGELQSAAVFSGRRATRIT